MTERDIGLEILEGIREIKAYKAGKIDLQDFRPETKLAHLK